VDQKCRIPAKCAFFAQVMRESRKLKTGWRMVQSDANQSPWSNSLITRENTENFADWCSTIRMIVAKSTYSTVT
jgi:hypothetical protein